MEETLKELFLDSSNIYELKQMSRERNLNSGAEINLNNLTEWTNSTKYTNIALLVERNNILYVIDELNKTYLEEISTQAVREIKRIHSIKGSDYYNPYAGFIDTNIGLNADTNNFNTTSFLDRTKSSFYKKNKSTKFKCMNARLNQVEKNDSEVDALENRYYITKKAKI